MGISHAHDGLKLCLDSGLFVHFPFGGRTKFFSWIGNAARQFPLFIAARFSNQEYLLSLLVQSSHNTGAADLMGSKGWYFVGNVLVQPLAQHNFLISGVVVEETSFQCGGQYGSVFHSIEVQPDGFRGIGCPLLYAGGQVGGKSGGRGQIGGFEVHGFGGEGSVGGGKSAWEPCAGEVELGGAPQRGEPLVQHCGLWVVLEKKAQGSVVQEDCD